MIIRVHKCLLGKKLSFLKLLQASGKAMDVAYCSEIAVALTSLQPLIETVIYNSECSKWKFCKVPCELCVNCAGGGSWLAIMKYQPGLWRGG